MKDCTKLVMSVALDLLIESCSNKAEIKNIEAK